MTKKQTLDRGRTKVTGGNRIWGREVQEVCAPSQRRVGGGVNYSSQERKQGQKLRKGVGGRQSWAMVLKTFAFLPQMCRTEPKLSRPPVSVMSSPSQCSSPVLIISCLDNFNSLQTGLTPPALSLAVQTPHCSQTDSSIRISLPCFLFYFFIISSLSGEWHQNFLWLHSRPLCWSLQFYLLSPSHFQGYCPFSSCPTPHKSFVTLWICWGFWYHCALAHAVDLFSS